MNEPRSVKIENVQFADLHKILPPWTEFYWKPKNDRAIFGVVVEVSEDSICIYTGFGKSNPKKLVLSSNDLLDWEEFVITRKGDLALAEFLKWEMLKIHHAANLGVAEAAKLALIDVAFRIKTRNLDELDYLLLEEIISQIISAGEAGKYFNKESAKHRRGRSYKIMNHVYHAVKRKNRVEGFAIDEKGAFHEVGLEFAMSASTVRRHYYQYKNILNIFKIGDYIGTRIEATVNPDVFNHRYKVISP